MKIYFAGSISAGREDQPLYEKIVALLKEYGTVATELIGSPNLRASGEHLSDKEIHDRDMEWLLQSECVVAEVTHPSLGVGYEIARACAAGIPVLALFRTQSDRRLSAMIAGCDGVVVNCYTEIDQVKPLLIGFFASRGLIKADNIPA